VFVPEYRTLCAYEIRGGGGFPGVCANPGPLYRIALSGAGAHGIGGTAAGNAMAALEHTIALVKDRSTSYTGARMRDFQLVQLRVASAGAKIDTALALLRNDCIEAQDLACRNIVADQQTKLRFKRNLGMRVSSALKPSIHCTRSRARTVSTKNTRWSASSVTRMR
jgi:3-hydroxy-9,10-secoandrosta-1,3,5(10)-triene-9,17-dione monooxygenase